MVSTGATVGIIVAVALVCALAVATAYAHVQGSLARLLAALSCRRAPDDLDGLPPPVGGGYREKWDTLTSRDGTPSIPGLGDRSAQPTPGYGTPLPYDPPPYRTQSRGTPVPASAPAPDMAVAMAPAPGGALRHASLSPLRPNRRPPSAPLPRL